MKVNLMRAGAGSYAVITTERGQRHIRLSEGMTVGASLEKTAQDYRAQAAYLLKSAELLEAARLAL